ncbi:MAG TPA: PIG-L deacetylase family protein [Thermoplasmata archaeon]|jgi:LmbE family N-acetylglucosaminyl deacetylase
MFSREKLRVLAVGAHPDDIEVGCAGTLLKHKSLGDDLVIAITTQGGYGGRSWGQIQAEALKASNVLGTEYIILDNKIGHYEMNWKTVGELDKIISEHKIDTVYSVWHGDSHQDHRLTFQNVLAACRRKLIQNLYCYELSDYSYRSQDTFNARFFVDISDYMDKKIESVKCYKSYITDQHIEAVLGLAKHRGLACGSEYAEAFEPLFNIWK